MSPRTSSVTAMRLVRRLFAGDPAHVAGAMVLDALVVVVAYGAALLLRFDGDIPRPSVAFTAQVLPAIVLAFIASNVAFGVYRTVWAYGGIGDILNLFRSILLVTVAAFAANFWLHERNLPLSVILIAGALIFPGMAMVKMRTRLLARVPWAAVASRKLLIIGAGRAGQSLARELHDSPESHYQPVGFLDDDPKNHHLRVQGLRVFGGLDLLEDVIRSRGVDMVAIALPRARGESVRQIVATCQRLDVPVRIVPGVDEWVHGTHHDDHLREITLEDLLGREPVEVDFAACSSSVHDRIVLVTGAAGSIGSELCRQLLTFEPRELHLVDNNESGLHDLSLEIREISPDTTIRLWIANVADQGRMEAIFERVRPQLVYHAAALKHVPLMEEHTGEAFRVNVLGTRYVAEAARTFQAETFVLISTDKAVRPTSVMGATKRIAELLIQGIAAHSEHTSFVIVRFGNVMGSRGSVVPTFMRQIERGGPVTVMHPEMKRYFISIPEAVALVIQAGTFGGHGSIYMLDMGDEINILELAERMIRLRGLRPGKDIEVVFTGPRPGEKLREELVADFERLEATEHPKIMRVTSDVIVEETEIVRLVDELRQRMWDDPEEMRRRIHLVARRYASGSGDEPADVVRDPAIS